jgi:hypothetical protein
LCRWRSIRGKLRLRESGSEPGAARALPQRSCSSRYAARTGQTAIPLPQDYTLNCNWKVYVDNYLDGGYHVPHLHKGLNSVLDYTHYTIENGERYCLQSSPMVASNEDAQVSATRKGDRAWYFWIYPNFMINIYEGVMDTNLVLPRPG